jgi:hypothetical protein
MDIFGYHIPGLIGVGATFGSVYGAFAKFDADQSEENRQFVREWLLGLKVDDQQWARFFKELFTRVFGDRHLSWKCFGRSAFYLRSCGRTGGLELEGPKNQLLRFYLPYGYCLRLLLIILVCGKREYF